MCVDSIGISRTHAASRERKKERVRGRMRKSEKEKEREEYIERESKCVKHSNNHY